MKIGRYILSAAAAVLTIAAAAAAYAVEPCELNFTQNPNGKYIYCNNHEAIRSSDLADMGNANAKFLMNNNGLTPDKYALFASFGNRTDIGADNKSSGRRGFDIEVDVLFRAVEDTEITLSSVGFEVPEQRNIFLNGSQYAVEDDTGCFTCWAQYLKMPIHQINSGNVYSPGDFQELTFTVKSGEDVWLSQFIPNYTAVPFVRSMNLMADFTINSGVCDVNVAALRSLGTVGDRSRFDKTAAYGTFYRDRQYKGISDGLNEVTAELSYTIDDSVSNGTKLPVTVHNQLAPEGNTTTDWYTHLNPRADEWSCDVCAESDMLSFSYYDPNKKFLYGSKVSDDEKDDYYHFDTLHTDQTAYDKAYGNAEKYIPNRLLTESDDTTYACNLANYGVIYNYNVSITNNGNRKRYMMYRLATSSNNIVYVKDSAGNIIDDRILSKGASDIRLATDMTCLPIPAQSTTTYTICVVLGPNYPGGMQNSLVISDYASLIETYETGRGGIEKDRYFDGREYYSWTGGTLNLSNDRIEWRTAALPDSVMKDISGSLSGFELLWTGSGYIIRPMLYDAGHYSNVRDMYKDMYLLDENFNLIRKQTFGGYPQAASVANGVYYTKLSGSVYRSTTEFKWWDLTGGDLPRWNYGKFSVLTDNGRISLSTNGIDFYEVDFKGFAPEYIDSYGEYYYYADGRVLYLSKDGLHWRYVMFNNKVKSFEIADGSVIANGSEERAVPVFNDTVAIKLNGKFISMDAEALRINNSPYIPLRAVGELLGYTVGWNDGTVTLEKGGTTTEMHDIIMIGETAYAPLKVIPLQLGIDTSYDGITAVADIVE